MATLTLYKSNSGYLDFASYDNTKFDLTATGWYLLDNSNKFIYGVLNGNNITYDAYNNPVLGTITAVSSLDKQGALQWTLSNIGVASNSSSSLKSAIDKGNPFDSYIINSLLNSNDSIIGSLGNDIIYISSGVDTIDGSTGNDYLNFSEYRFPIFSFNINLNVDLTKGTYNYVNNGVSTVQGYFSNIENITGSDEDDVLIGNTNNNSFEGGRGDNAINGGGGIDTVSYKNAYSVIADLTTGIATTRYYSFGNLTNTDTLSNIENMIGSVGDDIFTGNSLNNQLTGSIGNDTLNGNSGTDTVIFTNAYRAVNVNLTTGKATGEGLDILSNIENVIASNYNDTLIGSNSANALIANAGNDNLNGGLGNDTLTGNSGKDTFVFNTQLTANKDTITDFSIIDDTIQLENAIFTKLSTTGVLNTAYFKIATTAADNNDYIIYNKTTGALFYDADANGVNTAIQIATLGVNLALTNADFLVS